MKTLRYKEFLEELLCNNNVEIVKEIDQEFYESTYILYVI